MFYNVPSKLRHSLPNLRVNDRTGSFTEAPYSLNKQAGVFLP